VEVLAESEVDESGQIIEVESYVPAETGEGLVRIGDTEYVQDLEEKALDRRFAELVGTEAIARYRYVPVVDSKANLLPVGE
jgi:hypothetical protein